MEEYLTEKEVADKLKISIYTLRNDRSKRRGLPFVKLGGSVRYRESDIVKYMDEHLVMPGGNNAAE